MADNHNTRLSALSELNSMFYIFCRFREYLCPADCPLGEFCTLSSPLWCRIGGILRQRGGRLTSLTLSQLPGDKEEGEEEASLSLAQGPDDSSSASTRIWPESSFKDRFPNQPSCFSTSLLKRGWLGEADYSWPACGLSLLAVDLADWGLLVYLTGLGFSLGPVGFSSDSKPEAGISQEDVPLLGNFVPPWWLFCSQHAFCNSQFHPSLIAYFVVDTW